MGKKNDMKSRKKRFENQNRERTREKKVEEMKSSNSMLIWLGVAFAIVVVLVGYLVWQASNEGKVVTDNDQQSSQAAEQRAAQAKEDAQQAETKQQQQTSENNNAQNKPDEQKKPANKKQAIPISNDPNPIKKMVNGFPSYDFAPPMKIDTTKNYTATLKTSKGDIKIELYPSEAPKTVNNFIFLARDKYYDGVTFHRIMKDFMVQTGDPQGTGAGGPGYKFEDEFSFEHEYEEGVVAMANAGPNTNGSQFFIGTGKQVEILEETRAYTIFGKVVGGKEALKAVASTPVTDNGMGEQSKPLEQVIVKSIEIEES
jgi:cyclophilin family peptidyl-prolyl cis-trans isomerase